MEKSTVLGIIGFVLGLIGLILVSSLGIFFAIPGLILCIIQIKRNKTTLSIIGLILNIITIIIAIIILISVFVVWNTVAETVGSGTEEIKYQTGCITISLGINEINKDLDIITIQRRPGLGDLGKIKILINGGSVKEVDASDMYELMEKDISIDLNSGDKIQIIPVLGDGTLCNINDEKIV